MTIQDEITAQTLNAVKQAQDFTISTFNTVAERVTPLLPKLDVSFLNGLPKASEIVEKAFDFTSELLATAKNAAVEATKAFEPKVAPAKPAAKTTPKPAAAKPAAVSTNA